MNLGPARRHPRSTAGAVTLAVLLLSATAAGPAQAWWSSVTSSTRTILVATTMIPTRFVIEAPMVRYVTVPAVDVPADAFTDARELLGRVTGERIEPGRPITPDQLATALDEGESPLVIHEIEPFARPTP